MNIYGYLDETKFLEVRDLSKFIDYDRPFGSDKEVIIFRPDEYECNPKIIKILLESDLKKGTKLTIVNNNPDIRDYYRNLEKHFDLHYENFFTYYIFESVNALLNIGQQYSPLNPSKFMCSLNNNPRIERCKFMDCLEKHDLINGNYVTWQGRNLEELGVNYSFKYFDNRKMILDNIDTGNPAMPFEFTMPPKKAFLDSLWSIVSETTSIKNPERLVEVTEKTWIPITHKKPLLVFAPSRFYEKFQKLGFKLHDNLIDYSFDSIYDIDHRLERFMLEVKKLEKLDLIDTLEKTKDVVEHNYKNILKIIRDRIKNCEGDIVNDNDIYMFKKILTNKNVETPLCNKLLSR